MNLPNKLTLLRILLIPVFIVFAAVDTIPHHYLIACIVFSVASFTDFLDGAIARKYNMVTDFGKFADPLADKMLTTVAFIYMMKDGVCAPVVLVLILAREFAVSGIRMIAAGAKDGKVIAANIWGKVKTATQMITVVFYYLVQGLIPFGIFSAGISAALIAITYWLCWAIAALTVASGVQYLWANRKFINTAK